jgi:hypothetical protein
MHISSFLGEKIANRALAATFDERQTALRQAEHDLAMACWQAAFPEDHKAFALSAPDGWLRKDRCLRFTFGYRQTTLYLLQGQAVAVPYSRDCSTLATISSEDLIAQFEAHERNKAAFKNEYEQAEHALHSLIKGARTIKRLKEAWPEGLRFFADEANLAERGASVPAVVSTEVNRLLGLPAAEAQAAAP